MSELDFHLGWTEDAERRLRDDDHFQGELPVEPSGVITRDAPPEGPADGDVFEFSQARLRALDASLDRVAAQPRPPLLHYLTLLLHDAPLLTGGELERRLAGAESWLDSHLGEWQRCPPVAPEVPGDRESEERCARFNQGLAAVTDALHQAQELLLLLRHRQQEQAAALLDSLGERFAAGHQALFEAEP